MMVNIRHYDTEAKITCSNSSKYNEYLSVILNKSLHCGIIPLAAINMYTTINKRYFDINSDYVMNKIDPDSGTYKDLYNAFLDMPGSDKAWVNSALKNTIKLNIRNTLPADDFICPEFFDARSGLVIKDATMEVMPDLEPISNDLMNVFINWVGEQKPLFDDSSVEC